MSNYVGKEIKKTSNLIQRVFDAETTLQNENKLTFQDRQICGFLWANENRVIYQKDIENEFSLRRSSASARLKRMEQNGLVIRTGDSSDGRLKSVTLTEAAKKHLTTSCEIVKKVEELIVKDLTEEERASFLEIIRKIQTTLINCDKSVCDQKSSL